MGKNSVFDDVGTAGGKAVGAISKPVTKFLHDIQGGDDPEKPQAPPPPPNPANAAQQSAQNQVQNEANMRASRTLFTTPGGLLDDATPASRILLGGF